MFEKLLLRFGKNDKYDKKTYIQYRSFFMIRIYEVLQYDNTGFQFEKVKFSHKVMKMICT